MPRHNGPHGGPRGGGRREREPLDNEFEGTELADTLIGTENNDGFAALGGNDTIDAGDGNDRINAGFGDDSITAGAGNDGVKDGSGDDIIDGGANDDRLYISLGEDTVTGGDGDDRIISLGDTGEPGVDTIAGDDIITGGAGADKFIFSPLLNATDEIIAEYTNDRGKVNWKDVAMANDNIHDHWVEGIGNDTITDFNADEGDTIVISGHSVAVTNFEYGDSDNDNIDDYTILTLTSDQSAMGVEDGAHNGDALGTITVEGAILTIDDISINNMSYAAVNRLDTWDSGII